MGRIRQRLLNESVEIKRSEEKRKERQNKRYGKQIQVEKQKERERTKRWMGGSKDLNEVNLIFGTFIVRPGLPWFRAEGRLGQRAG